MSLKIVNLSTDTGIVILRLYSALGGKVVGRWLFSRLIGWLAPYTGTIGATVMALTPGYALVRLSDRRRVRNHLNSVHAMALANLGEMSTGLALICAAPKGTKAILVGYEIVYVKKARGPLVASCVLTQNVTVSPEPYEAIATIKNAKGEVVASVKAKWLVSTSQ